MNKAKKAPERHFFALAIFLLLYGTNVSAIIFTGC